MKKASDGAARKTKSTQAKPRAFHLVYDQAVRATLERGQRQEIAELLSGAKRLQAEYGDLDGLIAALETAVEKAC
jgi:hypothetical protein